MRATRSGELQEPRRYLTGVFGHANKFVSAEYTPPAGVSAAARAAHFRQWSAERRAAQFQHIMVRHIHALMANRKWKQRNLAQASGMSVEVLGRLLRGDMAASLRHIARLELALDVRLIDITVTDHKTTK